MQRLFRTVIFVMLTLVVQHSAMAQDAVSQGVAYANGQGVPRNDDEAVKWFRIGAQQGMPRAQAWLGMMYANGRGVSQDYHEAIRLYLLAARRGDSLAQTNLGEAYAKGWGVQEDDIASYMWLSVANTYQANSILIPYVAGKMSPEQIALAQKMATRCKETQFRDCGELKVEDSWHPAISVQMRTKGGTYVVPVLINNAITLDFVVDSGAADVSIPADVVLTLMRTGTINEADFFGKRTYVLADGSEVPSRVFRIRSLKVGSKILNDVSGSVAPVQGSLLLGQSFLSSFKSWSIENERALLLLTD
jgi:predicted aspartyl protease